MTAPAEDPRGGEARSGESAQPFGDWVKSIIRAGLARHGRTQAEMARSLGLSEKHVSQVLTGRASGSLDTINAMLEYADPDHSGYGRPLPATPYVTPPAAGRGDSGGGGEACTDCSRINGGVCCVPENCSARPAADRAQPTQELREAIARTIAVSSFKLVPDPEGGAYGTSASPEEITDDLIAGPLAALLDAQAAVSRVEALVTDMDGGTPQVEWVVGKLRAALDGKP